MALVVSIAVCALVLGLYGRSVLGTARHSMRELVRFLALTLGLLFILALLILLTILS